jgi:hypothetical protein
MPRRIVLAILSLVPLLLGAGRFEDTLRRPAQLTASKTPESTAFRRRGLALFGRYRPAVTERGTTAHVRQTGRAVRLGGRPYVEFPNSTALSTTDPVTGGERRFLVTRGVRAGYTNRVDLATGTQSPDGYVSDVLLFEDVGGEHRYRGRLLTSRPERDFLFEDPRISFVIEPSGARRIFLSGTDYAPHVPGSRDKDVMNRYVELELDGRGVPRPVKVGHDGRPAFRDLSPPPVPRRGGGHAFVDAKNATIAGNERGQIVVRTRMRPDFTDPEVRALAGGRTWRYGEQVFVFDDLADLQRYDWRNAMKDLFTPGGRGKVLLTDADLGESFDDPRVSRSHGKGMGPGTLPVRVRRAGDDLFVSDARGAPERHAGRIAPRFRRGFPLADGEVKYVAFDHEIRWFQDRGFTKRHYSLSVKLFDETLTRIDAYYPDVVQPKRLYERGSKSGIVDLHHVYPMGRMILADAKVRVTGGASDAHTPLYDFDVLKLLTEMR